MSKGRSIGQRPLNDYVQKENIISECNSCKTCFALWQIKNIELPIFKLDFYFIVYGEPTYDEDKQQQRVARGRPKNVR